MAGGPGEGGGRLVTTMSRGDSSRLFWNPFQTVILFLLGMLAVFCSGSDFAAEEELSALLPAPISIPGWARDGQPREFRGDDLYIYIDGGAEIYLEYGFRRVLIQDYESAGGKSLSLEIFEMSGPDSAYGMFSFKASGRGKEIDLGDGSELDSYYLNFWKGPYLVTITGFDEDRPTAEGLIALGRSVSHNIRESSKRPRLAETLVRLGYEPGGVRFIKGFLGLASLYSFGTARGLDFKSGARGIDAGGDGLIVLDYGSDGAAREAFSELKDYLRTSGRFSPREFRAPDMVVAVDGKNRVLSLSAGGSYLLLSVDTPADRAESLFRLVLEKLSEDPEPGP